jgi:hypothetical protein
VPDNFLLFRYYALTFNGHRIHYDRRYATEVEGYPGFIVHGRSSPRCFSISCAGSVPRRGYDSHFVCCRRFDSHRSTERHKSNRYDTRIVNPRSASNRERTQEIFFTLPLLCYNETSTENESRHLGQNEMAGLKGKSGPPGNMNAFKHGLAAIQKAPGGERHHRARGEC